MDLLRTEIFKTFGIDGLSKDFIVSASTRHWLIHYLQLRYIFIIFPYLIVFRFSGFCQQILRFAQDDSYWLFLGGGSATRKRHSRESGNLRAYLTISFPTARTSSPDIIRK
jgi:hypothetical protein